MISGSAAGDDLRHVDWNIYAARFDRLIIGCSAKKRTWRCTFVVDASPSMFAGEQEGPGQPEWQQAGGVRAPAGDGRWRMSAS